MACFEGVFGRLEGVLSGQKITSKRGKWRQEEGCKRCDGKMGRQKSGAMKVLLITSNRVPIGYTL